MPTFYLPSRHYFNHKLMKIIKKIVLFILKILLVLICYYATQLLVLGTKGLISKDYKTFRILFQLLIFPICYLWVNYLSRKWKENLPFVNNKKSVILKILISILIIILFYACYLAYLNIFYSANFIFVTYNNYPFYNLFLTILTLFALAAAEEILFRKLILNLTLTVTKNVYLVASLNGIIFLLSHFYSFLSGEFEYLWAIGVFSIAIFLSIYVLIYKDLVFPVFFHSLFNLSTSLTIEYDKYKIITFKDYEKHEYIINESSMYILAIFLMILTFLMIYKNRKSIVLQ